MIDFSEVKSMSIPEGAVQKISDASGKVLWQKYVEPAGPTNLIPTATDTDGSIYNGKGYKEKQRINSSGGVVSYDYCTLTGFMPLENLTDATRIYVKGLTFDTDGYYNGVALYDADKKIMCSFRSFPNASGDKVSGYNAAVSNVYHTTGTSVTLTDGISTIVINVVEESSNYKRVKFFRLYGQPTGENLVVTVDEEIVG